MKPNSFKITIRKNIEPDQNNSFLDHNISLETSQTNPNYIRKIVNKQTGFSIFIGERGKNDTQNENEVINGTLIKYKMDTRCLKIESDATGSEYLYYRYNSSEIEISNRLDNLINSNDEADFNSIHCFLSFGYTLSDRTFFKEISKTMPNEIIYIDIDNLKLAKKRIKQKYHSSTSGNNPDLSYSEALKEICAGYGKTVLMMSAGWDSRTVLSASAGNIAAAYTHGDLSSREIGIARKITGSLRTDHFFKDSKNITINNELLDEMLSVHGHCLWPIWLIAYTIIAEKFGFRLKTGVIGARMGGHNGITAMGSRQEKIKNAFILFLPRKITNSYIKKNAITLIKAPRDFWFSSKKASDIFNNISDVTNNQISKTIYDYFDQENDYSFALERFNYDHISRQYMMKQAIMSSHKEGYYSPLGHPHLLSMAYALPLKKRIQNSFSRKVIKLLNPALLNFPMAATLAKAERPIPIQEASRALRLILEKIFRMITSRTASLGWFNYEHLYDDGTLVEIVDSLQSDMWDKNKMKNVISTNTSNNIDAGSTLDMLCKIKTVDYYLTFNSMK